MRAKDAEKLRNRDEVEVRIAPGEWDAGYVVGDASITTDGVFVDVQTRREGFLAQVRHTDLR
jgi:hypothetical protein